MILILFLFSTNTLQQPIKGDVSIRVQVWGEIKSPGIYPVPPTTNIIEAISFAGGPTSRSDLKRVKLVKALKGREVVFYDVEEYINGDNDNPPILDSGDLIFIPQSMSSKVWDFVRFFAIVAGTAYSIYRITSN